MKTKKKPVTVSKPAMAPVRKKRPATVASQKKCIAANVGHRRCNCGGPDCGENVA